MQNLLCFVNGDRTFTWDKVRQLSSVSDTDLQVDYTYDDAGIRTSKTVNGVTTHYNTKDAGLQQHADGYVGNKNVMKCRMNGN